jgi:hypothetical protein
MANLSANTILDACYALRALGDTAPIAGGTLTINGNSLGSYDYYKVTGNQTVSAFASATYFTATADSVSAFVIIDGDLTINAGQVFQPANRKLFTVIFVTGNLIVNGQISMSQRGANHSTTGSNIAAADILIANGQFAAGITNPKVPATGTLGVPASRVQSRAIKALMQPATDLRRVVARVAIEIVPAPKPELQERPLAAVQVLAATIVYRRYLAQVVLMVVLAVLQAGLALADKAQQAELEILVELARDRAAVRAAQAREAHCSSYA